MKWISVKDKMPERQINVLILTDYGKMATAYCVNRRTKTWGWIDAMRPQHSYGSVTHWMPLPEPPKD